MSASLFRTIIKWLLIALAIMAVMGIVALKLIERSPDQLKVGFESYLTQLAGYPAEIGTLNKVTFFPTMAVDLENVRFWPIDNPDGSVISIKTLSAQMPFWSILIGRPRFAGLLVEEARFEESATGIAPMVLTRLAPNANGDALDASGKIGDLSLTASVPLEKTRNSAYLSLLPPVRVTGTIDGGRTNGDFFIDVNKGDYGATATFSRYRASDVRPLQLLMQHWLKGRTSETMPVQFHLEALMDKNGGRSGPYLVPALQWQTDNLQPLECFYNNQGRAQPGNHPCAAYFKEPDISTAP